MPTEAIRQLSGMDSAFLSVETEQTPMHVAGITLINLARAPRGFGFAAVRDRVAERLGRLPIFRRRLLGMPLNLVAPLWIEDPEFSIDRHVSHLHLPAPGRDAQFNQLVASLISKPLDRSRPLWAAYYVDGLSRHRAACILVIHHACIDGVAGIDLLNTLLDSEPAPPPAPVGAPHQHPRDPSAAGRLWFTVRQATRHLGHVPSLVRQTLPLLQQLRHPAGGSGEPADAGDGIGGAPPTRFNVAIDASRSYAWRSLPLERIKAIKNTLGLTVNEVLLIVCTGALRRYLLDKAELPDRPLIAAVPVSVRGEDDHGSGGNYVSALGASLPIHLPGLSQRVAVMTRGAQRFRKARRALPARLLMDWIEVPAPSLLAQGARLYGALIGHNLYRPPANLVISNVPGPQQQLFLAGAPVSAICPVSVPYHGLALNITVLSYQNQLNLGLTACKRAVPDVDRLLELIGRSVDELDQFAQSRRCRRAPGARPSKRPATPRRGASRRAARRPSRPVRPLPR